MSAGYRSFVAPWVGGASASSTAPTIHAGYRSMQAFWLGGASAGASSPTPPGVDETSQLAARLYAQRLFQLQREDEEIIVL